MADIYEVKITKQAQEQIIEIIDYISYELFAPEAANSLLRKMQKSIMDLAEFPERNQLVDEEPWKTEGVRKIVVNNFLIYFWINNNAKKVQVIAVIYSKRNQLEQLRYISTEDELLERLRKSRQHADEGKYRDADDVILDMRKKYKLI